MDKETVIEPIGKLYPPLFLLCTVILFFQANINNNSNFHRQHWLIFYTITGTLQNHVSVSCLRSEEINKDLFQHAR